MDGALERNNGSTSDSFRRFGANLREAQEWVRSLGIRIEPTRFGAYVRLADKAIGGWTPRTKSESAEAFDTVIATIHSGSELIQIHSHFRNERSPEFFDRLKKLVSGPIREDQEKLTSSSNAARNFGLELAVGTHFAEAGFAIEFPAVGDLQIEHPEARVECKRLQVEGQIGKAVSDAAHQLKKRNTDAAPRVPGLIVLGIGKLYHRGGKILKSQSESSIRQRIYAILEEFVVTHQHMWQEDPKEHVQAVLAYYSGIGHVIPTNQWMWCTFFAISLVEEIRNETMKQSIDAIIKTGLGPSMIYSKAF